jgi:hypothetical protein
MPVSVRFGDPVMCRDQESVRDFGVRIHVAVSQLLDEDATNWWDARRRAARGSTPEASGPAVAGWRRVWAQTAPPVVSDRQPVWHR